MPAARTLTSASPGPGEPTGVLITASTSGPPNAVATTALVIPESSTASFFLPLRRWWTELNPRLAALVVFN